MQIPAIQISQTWWEGRFNVILIAIDEGSYERHFFPELRSDRWKFLRRSQVPIMTSERTLGIVEFYDSCNRILPGLWGAPASIRCASPASARGSTDPTRAEIVPFSNSVFKVFSREVVTSA